MDLIDAGLTGYADWLLCQSVMTCMREPADPNNVRIEPWLQEALEVRNIDGDQLRKIVANPAYEIQLESFLNAKRWGATGWLEDGRRIVVEYLSIAGGIRIVTQAREGLPEWNL